MRPDSAGYGCLIRVEEAIEIACPPEVVCSPVADPLNDPCWCPKLKQVEPAGDRRWTVTQQPVALRAPMELTLVHLVVQPPSRLTLREDDEASVFVWSIG